MTTPIRFYISWMPLSTTFLSPILSVPSMDGLDFKFDVEPHFGRSRFISRVDLAVIDRKRTQIARGYGMIINRSRMGDAFHQIMDEDDAETASFSLTIFDKFGRIKSRLVDDEYHKGSGVWGRELNEGMIIFIYEIEVEPPVRLLLPFFFRRNPELCI
jgi:hypothetical protein